MAEPVAQRHPFAGILRAECDYRLARRIIRFRRDYPEFAWVIESRACPYCEAKPGELCRRSSGRIAWYHAPRTGLDG